MNPAPTRTHHDGDADAWEWRGRIEGMLRPLAGLASDPPLAVRLDRIERICKIGAWMASLVVMGLIALLINQVFGQSERVKYVEVVPNHGGK